MKSILLVDDQPEVLQGLLRHFREHADEWSVTTASDGHEALGLAQSNTFDVVVTDVLMPGTDGIETLRAFKQGGADTKVIVMSGGGRLVGLEPLEVARLMGADATLQKPFEFAALRDTIRDLLSAEAA